jgi:hypothetical protein
VSAKQVAVRGSRFWLSFAAAASMATFSVGLATGASLPRAANGGSQDSGSHTVVGQAAGQPNVAVLPRLDTSKTYLTIQHGVVVPGVSVSPVLDTSRTYLTIQSGVVVPGH